jgi:hypothetical protein
MPAESQCVQCPLRVIVLNNNNKCTWKQKRYQITEGKYLTLKAKRKKKDIYTFKG